MEPSPSKLKQPSPPFLMPDGRPLGLFLQENHLVHDKPRRKGKKRPGAIKAAKEGWTGGKAARAATAASTVVAAADGYRSDAEQMEAEALARVGQRRRRRYLADKLLRDMAGRLTAHDMEALFKPVPFGETGHVSLFSQATSPEFIQVWDLFRSVDMDKESRVLQKWEAHVRELQQGSHAIQDAAVNALAAWSSVSWKARRALRRANPSHVEDIEARLLAFLERQGEDEGEEGAPAGSVELVLELEDGFGRLMAHGLAEFHGLASFSRLDDDGIKRVVLRRRRTQPGEGPPSSQQQHKKQGPTTTITCSDILALLVDGPDQGLTSRVLHDAYCQSQDTSSEAGGPGEQLAPLVQAQMTLVAVQ